MKTFLLILLSLNIAACASQDDREPASTEEQDVSRGVNADYFGPSR